MYDNYTEFSDQYEEMYYIDKVQMGIEKLHASGGEIQSADQADE
eukprot:COSAG01_NODE_456_length_16789_cov_58.288556_9_plen_44_part_00